ncbi:MAG: NAD(P)-dependent oxidoreductase [Chloroflexi bacterium]|nr:NAD(P)-dependent oxidoreductase [Chloroflexota bacterium]
MNLTDKRVLVTGASGFIGGRVAERLAQEEGARVRVLVRGEGGVTPPLQVCRGDMTDADAVRRAVGGCDVVIHCAAKQFPPGMRAQFIAENVGGFENLARAALECGVARFVHLSTINVHGYPPPPGCHADSPLRESGDFYSDSKIAAERVAWRYYRERRLPLVVVRPACTFGPLSGAWTLTPLRRVRAGKRVLMDDGSALCNPVYIDNLVDLILLATKSDAAIGQAFIGSDGVGISWREFYGAYARMLGIPRLNSLPLFAARAIAFASEAAARLNGKRPFVARQSVEFYSHHVVYDISKARKLLGHVPRVSFEEGMRRTERWLVDSGKFPEIPSLKSEI